MRVLETPPQHWAAPLGLFRRGAIERGAWPCAPLNVSDPASYEAGRDDVARLKANWRNLAVARGLEGSGVRTLHVWRALVPAWDQHRSPRDCTHLGFDALVFIARVLYTFLTQAPEWRRGLG